MSENRAHRGYFSTVFSCRCPRCREGKLFEVPLSIDLKKVTTMNKYCPVCGQPTEIEVGFYYGTGFVSYALTVLLSGISLIIWWLLIGFAGDSLFIWWLIVNAVALILLQPWLMRISRSFWISWFVSYDPDWKHNQPVDVSERSNVDQANNW